MNPLKKLAEEIICKQLVEFFETENIIPDQHHGGRNKHSTLSTKLMINKYATDKVEDCNSPVLLATDLSQAYDLVTHEILVKKLAFHRVSKSGCRLIASFLKGRSFVVDVQGFREAKQLLHHCSVIQGSKLSGFLYTVFSIEIALLPQLMKKKQL